MSETTVNVPLLRKAVEWAEAEAAKPADLCEWNQGVYAEQRDCGTAYCIAGFVALTTGMQKSVFRDYIQAGMSGADAATRIHDTAARELGLSASGADELFGPSNTIELVREIAESIAGERL